MDSLGDKKMDIDWRIEKQAFSIFDSQTAQFIYNFFSLNNNFWNISPISIVKRMTQGVSPHMSLLNLIIAINFLFQTAYVFI